LAPTVPEAHELTPDTGDDDYWAVWSPDGTRIAFDRTGPSAFGDIWVMNADGSGQKRLTTSPGDDLGSAWSPDGEQIAFQSSRTARAGTRSTS
jgi:Tol biopolymer transport system component